ncbi:MAG: VIT and VWA domain-containing protein [Planctomycetota bacterium]
MRRNDDAELMQRLSPNEEIWIVEDSLFAKRRHETRREHGCYAQLDDGGGQSVAMPIKLTSVRAEIAGFTATVDLKQVYHNPYSQKINLQYLFPLPVDAAVSEFVMTVGERRIRGIVREKKEAEQLYREARDAGLIVALLTQDRPNIFEQKIANIDPGHAIQIDLRYFQTLPYRDGGFEFSFPMVVGPRFNPSGSNDPIHAVSRGTPIGEDDKAVVYLNKGDYSGHRIELSLELNAGVTIEDIKSETHRTQIERRSDRQARITLAASDDVPNRDFVLRYQVAGNQLKTGIVTQSDSRGSYFSLMMVPPRDIQEKSRRPVELVFVIDTSGSMRGLPIEKAKAAIRRALRASTPSDSFRIIRFSESASSLGEEALAATSGNIRRAMTYLDRLEGGGGTHMLAGIRAALDPPVERGRQRIVSFMTDGFIGNEDQIFRAVYANVKDARIFSFGIGSSVNRHLIEGLARLGRGAAAYVSLDGDGGRAVDAFYDRIRHPALENIQINWGGADVVDVYPRRIPDLFVGRPVVLTGRFRGGPPRSIQVEGRREGRRCEQHISLGGRTQVNADLSKIWARRKLADLDYESALGRAGADRDALSLALEYGIVSRLTAFLAVDASRRTFGHPGPTIPVAVPLPEGLQPGSVLNRRR